jgi:hypothetical protein
MSVQKSLIAVCAGALLFAATASAQTTATAAPAAGTTASAQEGGAPTYIRAETPEQRKQRIGTTEDPGLDPDPKKHFWRFGQSVHIERYERRWAAFDTEDKNWVRPFSFANISLEIYQVNDKFVWVWVPDKLTQPGPAEPVAEAAVAQDPYNDATYAFLKRVRSQYSELVPKAGTKLIRFRDSSTGLPTNGSWRVSASVADMNGDKCPDIVAPPERKGNGVPAIFLGDCKGGWRYWAEASFPERIDYGSVITADFNKDGKMDIAAAVHLNGLFVVLGDGKGKFTDASTGLPHDFPTRRAVAADVDKDGYPDLVVLSEGPTQMSPSGTAGPVRAYLNRKKGTLWQLKSLSSSEVRAGGDWMTTGDFNGDSLPDFAVSSVFYGSTDVMFLSSATKTWAPYASDGDVIPSLSYYFANTAGKFTSKKQDDAVISYVRFWPQNVNPDRVSKPELLDVTSVDLVRFVDGKPVRTALARWGARSILAVGAGDFDGDKNLDVIFLRDKPREATILLGDGKGEFASAKVEGLPIENNPIYDVRVADVNNDGRSDVILMYESGGKTTFAERDGSIRVFMDVATEAAPPAASTAEGAQR